MAHVFDYRNSSSGVHANLSYLFVQNTSYTVANNLFYQDGVTAGTYTYFDDFHQQWVSSPTSQATTGVVSFGVMDQSNSSDVYFRDAYGDDVPDRFDESTEFTGIDGGPDYIWGYFRLFGIAAPQLVWDNTAVAADPNVAAQQYEANIAASAADYAGQLDAVLAMVVQNRIEYVDWNTGLTADGQPTAPQAPSFVMEYTPSAGSSLTYGDFLSYTQDSFGRTGLASQGDGDGGLGGIFGADETVELLLTDQADLVNATELSAGTLILDLAGGNDLAQLFYDDSYLLPGFLELDAGSGDDQIYLGEFMDTEITLGSGDDVIYLTYGYYASVPPVAPFQHTIRGGAGNDVIVGGPSQSVLTAFGGEGRDWIYGGAHADVLDGGKGADYLFGSRGDDTYHVTESDRIEEYAGEGRDTAIAAGSFTLQPEVENLILTGTGNTKGTGNASANHITGNAGANVLKGGGGNDTLVGGAGNDTYVTDGGDRIVEKAGGGIDTVRASVGFALGANLEHLILIGTGDINGTGNTRANKLTGNSGANVLKGGEGNDTLTGGAGQDAFVFNTTPGAGNVDRITDFDVAQDVIQLKASVFAGLPRGVLSEDAFAQNGSGRATEAQHRVIHETDTGKLFYDSDGTGAAAAVHFATVTRDLLALTSEDFLLF